MSFTEVESTATLYDVEWDEMMDCGSSFIIESVL